MHLITKVVELHMFFIHTSIYYITLPRLPLQYFQLCSLSPEEKEIGFILVELHKSLYLICILL